jgi:acyl dehydratase
MPSTLAALPRGYEFPTATFTLTRDWVDAYVDATADETTPVLDHNAVPPMAVAALSIRALIEASPLPPGTLHAGQELAFTRSVSVGEELSVGAKVVSRGERAGWVLMSIDIEVSVASEKVMTGRGTLTFPVES